MCGIVGLLTQQQPTPSLLDEQALQQWVEDIHASLSNPTYNHLCTLLPRLQTWVNPLPGFATCFMLGQEPQRQSQVESLVDACKQLLPIIEEAQNRAEGFQELEGWNELHLTLQDTLWRLSEDILNVQKHITQLCSTPWTHAQTDQIRTLWEIEFALRGLERLEIRGRDSGGISILISFQDAQQYTQFVEKVKHSSTLFSEWQQRTQIEGLIDQAICGHDIQYGEQRQLLFLYKVAAEVGNIGDNVNAIRETITHDPIVQELLKLPGIQCNALTHTRWASNGIINTFNCHPQGNDTHGMTASETKLFAVLNGDIDNFQELLAEYTERTQKTMPEQVTTDAKIIPLMIEERYRKLGDLREAFRQCLLEFEGSFAIAFHHLDYPDKVWLGIGGSGQSLYVGIHPHTTFFASELYGVVEGATTFVKLDGEKEREPGNTSTRGQMLELSRDMIGQERPFLAHSFDGTPLSEKELPLQQAQITTRDINISGFRHFFLKEVSESVSSVRNTLHGRFFLNASNANTPFSFNFDQSMVPKDILAALEQKQITNIYCIGQGTAAIAAMGVAESLKQHLPETYNIRATKATELSGHMLRENMDDTLIIAVSQSGSTTDTNRTIDLVRQRGGRVLAILNRRNSDMAYKAEGVIFTSNGRDVEMSVASTKAFYSQVTAGALLALYLAHQLNVLSAERTLDGLRELQSLPAKMESVLAQNDRVREVAQQYALKKRYWAIVGSGPNQIAAHEIRIKLSELCYKSISCDFIEDKKHIDLSAEPLILISALGLDPTNLSDSVKEVSIFKAHNSIPIVIASKNAKSFETYAAAVFEVPESSPALAPIFSTMIGHLFGYHAACAIEEQSQDLRKVRSTILHALPTLETDPEQLLASNKNNALRAQLLTLVQQLQTQHFNSSLEVNTAVTIALQAQRLLYAHLDEQVFDTPEQTESPFEIAQAFLQTLTQAINELSRPIDAIKHQAKTVTVGISRPSPTLSGAFLEIFKALQVDPSTILWRNFAYLIAAEPLVHKVKGAILYRIEHLKKDGFPSSKTQIFKEAATGIAEVLPSRTDQ
ncbi:MAG: SIS domain-containing protein, partial [Myxococcota bacterium]